MGSCEFLHRIILALRPGCFMLRWCLSFPSSYLNPSDIIYNYFKKAEAQRDCPWWMGVISVLWLPQSYYSSAISGCLPVWRIPSRINCISRLLGIPGRGEQVPMSVFPCNWIVTCLLRTAEGQYKQEDRHSTDFQVFANSQKLVKRGGKEKITPVFWYGGSGGCFYRALFTVTWRSCHLLLCCVKAGYARKLQTQCLWLCFV